MNKKEEDKEEKRQILLPGFDFTHSTFLSNLISLMCLRFVNNQFQTDSYLIQVAETKSENLIR